MSFHDIFEGNIVLMNTLDTCGPVLECSNRKDLRSQKMVTLEYRVVENIN